MTEKRKHITPTAELIRLYHEGKLDDRTMHDLEKQALDDPFLADALDGFAAAPAAAEPQHIEDLQARLAKRVNSQQGGRVRRISYYWAAAAVSLLVITAGLFWMMQAPQEKGVVAKQLTIENHQEADTGNRNLLRDGVVRDTASVALSSAAESAGELGPVITQEKVVPAPVVTAKDAPVAAAAEAKSEDYQGFADAVPSAPKKEMHIDTATAANMLRRQQALAAREVESREKAYTANILRDSMMSKNAFATGINANGQRFQQNIVQGRVTDASNNPLPGVTVFQKNTRNGVVTDNLGNFRMQLDTGRTASLAVNYVGYDKQEVALRPGDNNLSIVLNESHNALSEVVTVGYGAQMKKNGAPIQPPRPKDGFEEYDDYLAANTQYSQHMRLVGVNDSVQVSFDVTRDGRLENFRIEKGSGLATEVDKAARAEAIRVIKEGPKWAPASNHKKTRVKIFVRFRPAKKQE